MSVSRSWRKPVRNTFVLACTAVLATGCGSDRAVPTAPSTTVVNPATSYTVSGVVTTGGVPASGVSVRVVDQRPDVAALTDGSGRYSIQARTAQMWGMSPLISASKPGYFTETRFTDANYQAISKDTQVDFDLEAITAVITPGDIVRGRVGGAVCSHWGFGAGSCARVAVRVPTSGTLEVTASAARSEFDIDILTSDGMFAVYDSYPYPSGSARVKIPVSAGSTYQIRLTGAPWDFELTTALH
jgi:hypothetical protein